MRAACPSTDSPAGGGMFPPIGILGRCENGPGSPRIHADGHGESSGAGAPSRGFRPVTSVHGIPRSAALSVGVRGATPGEPLYGPRTSTPEGRVSAMEQGDAGTIAGDPRRPLPSGARPPRPAADALPVENPSTEPETCAREPGRALPVVGNDVPRGGRRGLAGLRGVLVRGLLPGACAGWASGNATWCGIPFRRGRTAALRAASSRACSSAISSPWRASTRARTQISSPPAPSRRRPARTETPRRARRTSGRGDPPRSAPEARALRPPHRDAERRAPGILSESMPDGAGADARVRSRTPSPSQPGRSGSPRAARRDLAPQGDARTPRRPRRTRPAARPREAAPRTTGTRRRRPLRPAAWRLPKSCTVQG